MHNDDSFKIGGVFTFGLSAVCWRPTHPAGTANSVNRELAVAPAR